MPPTAIADNGAAGNPDGDYDHRRGHDRRLHERRWNSRTTPIRARPTPASPPPVGSIVDRPADPELVGGVSNAKEFTDWTVNDLIVARRIRRRRPEQPGRRRLSRLATASTPRATSSPSTPATAATSPPAATASFYFRVDFHDLAGLCRGGEARPLRRHRHRQARRRRVCAAR